MRTNYPVPFEYWVMEGSSYEVGQFQGNAIKKHIASTRFLSKIPKEMDARTKNVVRDVLGLYKQFSPGLTEEIQGCADCLSISPDKLILYTLS
ncbi:MAG: hypothetical protein N2376_10605, partial [Clostridia bacterium]|nr:hypothetical protein [Clostridia bacterium]